jgi:hypothetical protein
MTDLPLNKKSKKVNELQPSVKPEIPVTQTQNPTKVEVTHENADLITVHFLSQIFGRLGYIIKLLEEKK